MNKISNKKIYGVVICYNSESAIKNLYDRIDKEIFDKIKLSINDFGFEIDLSTQIAKNNFKIYEYGISYFARTYKEGKKINIIDGLRAIVALFRYNF